MKSELKLKPHECLSGEMVVEVWHGHLFIGAIYGADGPGIRFISKHMPTAQIITVDPMVTEIVFKE